MTQLRVTDITFVAPWAGFVYVALVVHVYAERIMDPRVAATLRTELVLDALKQAPWSRPATDGLVLHSDRGSQYLSIRHTERQAEAGVHNGQGSRLAPGGSCWFGNLQLTTHARLFAVYITRLALSNGHSTLTLDPSRSLVLAIHGLSAPAHRHHGRQGLASAFDVA